MEINKVESTNSPAPTTNKTETLWMILGILVIILLAGYIGYWYGSMNPIKNTDLSLKTTPEVTSTQKLTATPTIDPYNGWKTYTDTNYGFSIEYPEDWTVKVTEAGTAKDLNNNKIVRVQFSDANNKPKVLLAVGGLIMDFCNGGTCSTSKITTLKGLSIDKSKYPDNENLGKLDPLGDVEYGYIDYSSDAGMLISSDPVNQTEEDLIDKIVKTLSI